MLVDEAHAFRNPDTDQYRALSRLMGGAKKKLCLMTATPVNNSIRDLYHQLMLFARHTARFRSIGIPDLNGYFRAAEEAAQHGDSASAMFQLIDATSVRRTRRFIQQHYPNAQLDGKPITFPEPQLKTKYYDLDESYPSLFAQVAADMDRLTLARYNPDQFRLDQELDLRAQALAGILRTGLLKRFESSVQAFRMTAVSMIEAHQNFLRSLDEGRVLVPGTSRAKQDEDDDPAALASQLGQDWAPAAEYDVKKLRAAVELDRRILEGFLGAVADATIDNDPKLDALAELLGHELGEEKAIVFSYYADTADWIAKAIEADPARFGDRRFVAVTGTSTMTTHQRLEAVHRFSPKTTGEEAGTRPVSEAEELDLLVSTDVLAEGQNLQQARYIVNYDMPWNPMRLVQRNGRIDRIGSPFAGQEIYLWNLFPAGELDQILNLYKRLLDKIAHANISVGMEAPVFEEAAAIERNFADTAEQIRGIAGEDAAILDEAEAQLDAFSGEEFRMELRSALAADRLRELEAMPHGAGSGFREEELPDGASGVFFGARVLLGTRPTPSHLDERAWRFVPFDDPESPLRDELEILGRIRCPDGTPREVPEGIEDTLYKLWAEIQSQIVADYAERLDPAASGTQIPPSQAFAIELLAKEGASLAEHGVRASAVREGAAALAVPRGPLIQRQLSALRRELRDGDITPAAAGREVLEVVQREGLRPPDDDEGLPLRELTADRVRLICWQLVHS